MKTKIIKGFVVFLMALVAMVGTTSCCERVDAGHEGILVNLYGDDKGVGEVSMCTGMVWYNPFTTIAFCDPGEDTWKLDGRLFKFLRKKI